MTNLTSLRLNDNNITTITSHDFGTLPELRVLDLQGNQISQIEPLALQGLRNLSSLLLHNNELVTIPSAFLHTTLTDVSIDMNENDLNCTCATKHYVSILRSKCRSLEATLQNCSNAMTSAVTKFWGFALAACRNIGNAPIFCDL